MQWDTHHLTRLFVYILIKPQRQHRPWQCSVTSQRTTTNEQKELTITQQSKSRTISDDDDDAERKWPPGPRTGENSKACSSVWLYIRHQSHMWPGLQRASIIAQSRDMRDRRLFTLRYACSNYLPSESIIDCMRRDGGECILSHQAFQCVSYLRNKTHTWLVCIRLGCI